MPTQQTIFFDADGYQLVGTLHLPDMPEPPLVIGCHGLLANRQSQKQITLASACNKIGFAYFRFDHRGCGDSQGKFMDVTSLDARSKDLYHAITTMQYHSGTGPLAALFGSSFGGTVVLAHACIHPVQTVITYAAPINSETIHHGNIRDNHGTAPDLESLNDALTFNISADLSSIKNGFISHSAGDETVPVIHAHQIYNKLNSPKLLHIFDGGDHRMTPPAHQKQFESLFIDWIGRPPTET